MKAPRKAIFSEVRRGHSLTATAEGEALGFESGKVYTVVRVLGDWGVCIRAPEGYDMLAFDTDFEKCAFLVNPESSKEKVKPKANAEE